MDRITVFDGEFWVHKNFPPVKDDTVDEFVDCVKELAARLAAYEDTGLEPEEIERILDSYGRGMTLRTENAQRLEIIKEIPINRLRELAQAYQLLGNTVYEPNKRGVISTYKIPVKSQNPGFAQKRDTSLQSKYTSRVKALIKTYVEIERKYPK